MKKLLIPELESQPGILFDPEKKVLRMWGRACPEDAFEFYEPVIRWLEEYLETEPQDLTFEFALTYYNTATSKVIMKILQMLEQLHKKTGNVKIVWYYMPDDEDMLIAGEDYSEIVEVPFEVKPIQ